MKGAVLFDLDGTLTDPSPGITRCVNHALERLGEPARDPDSLLWCIGPPLRASFETLVPGRADEAMQFYRERFADVGMFENSVFEGVPEMLDDLRRDSVLFVATSKPTIYATKIIDHFGLSDRFRAVYGSELDGTRSEKGDLVRYVADTERLVPGDGVMVGDRKHDVLGARQVGMRSVGVLYGFGTREELDQAGATQTCGSPFEVPGAVRFVRLA